MKALVSPKIKCSVGILTFNSAKTLRRALESVKNFSDIVISDGGSTDETLSIARAYGATVIEQIAKLKPGPEPRHPITDFAAEHNKLLDSAKEDWYLRLDSDEYISGELQSEIASAVQDTETDLCEIPMHLQSPDGGTTYYMPKAILQPRLLRRNNGRFQRPIHEAFVFHESPRTKTLHGAWYVPISKPDFATYRWAVNYRLALGLAGKTRPTILQYVQLGILTPLKRAGGIMWRAVSARVAAPLRRHVPLYYVRNRLYSQWVAFKLQTKLLVFGKL